jgi:hypothetical protein
MSTENGDQTMNLTSKAKILAVFLITAALLTAILPGEAPGAVKKVKPGKLLHFQPGGSLDVQSPYFVSCGGGPCLFYYPLKLPVGTVIKGLSYQHSGQGALAKTIVGLDRVRPSAALPLQRIYHGEMVQGTGALYNTVKVNGALLPGAVKKVQKGWRYFLTVQAENNPGPHLGAVGIIKVTFEPPAP